MAADRIRVWECIGCGRIDHPQPCVGVCRDQRAELVHAHEYDESQARVAVLEAWLRRLAFTTPRPGEWESAYKALQKEARRLF
jgi:hypothetical protein